MKRVINLTEGTIWKQVLLFSIPLLLSNLLQQLYSAIDLMIVGNFVGEHEMAAVGATASLTNMIIGLFMGLATGCSVIVSQYYGADNYEGLQKSVHTAYALAILGGLFLTIIGYFASPLFLTMMDTPVEIIDHSITYMRIYFAGSIPLLIYNMGAGILRSVGDSRRPFYFLVVSTVANFILDLIFIWGFRWGVAGAGWATVISVLLSTVLVTYSLTQAHTKYHLSLRKIYLHIPIFESIVKIGIPAGIQGMLISFSNVLIQTRVNTFGPIAIGGVAAASRLDGLVFSVLSSFALSATTFAGQNIGAGNMDRVRKGAKEIAKLTFTATFIVGMTIFLLRYPLLSLFTQSQGIIEVGARMASFLTPFYWVLGLINMLDGYIRGSGESLRPMLISMFGMCIFRLGYLYIALNIRHALDLIFLCYPVSWVVTLSLMFLYYKKGKWHKVYS